MRRRIRQRGAAPLLFSAEAPAAEHARPDSRASANPGPQTRAPRPLPARPYAAPRPDRPPPAPEQRPHGAAPSLVNTPSRRSRTSAVPAARRLAEASDPPHPRRTPPQPVPPRHLPYRIRTPHRRRSRTLARSPPASSVTAGRTAAKSHPPRTDGHSATGRTKFHRLLKTYGCVILNPAGLLESLQSKGIAGSRRGPAIKGNRVRIPNSSRCCKRSPIADTSCATAPAGGKAIRRRRESEDLPLRLL